MSELVVDTVVVVSGTNHYGIAGWYSMRASEQGLIVRLNFLFIKIKKIQDTVQRNLYLQRRYPGKQRL